MSTLILNDIDNLIYTFENQEYIDEGLFQDLVRGASKLFKNFNYGVSQRAIDEAYGNKENLVKEVKKKYTDDYLDKIKNKEIDPEKMEREIKKLVNNRINELSTDKHTKEFVNQLKEITITGIVGSIVNGIINGIISLIFLDIEDFFKQVVRSMIIGFFLNVIHRLVMQVYYEIKKRMYKDPYADITFIESEIMAIFSISIVIGPIVFFITSSAAVAFSSVIASILLTMVFHLIAFLFVGVPKYVKYFESQRSFKE